MGILRFLHLAISSGSVNMGNRASCWGQRGTKAKFNGNLWAVCGFDIVFNTSFASLADELKVAPLCLFLADTKAGAVLPDIAFLTRNAVGAVVLPRS